MANAPRDDNKIPTLLAVSNADGSTPVTLYADPTTHRLLVSATAGAFDDLSDVVITSVAQGQIIYYNGTNWVNLATGVSGRFLETQGAGANPRWGTPSTSAGGSTTQVQYNSSGSLAGITGLTSDGISITAASPIIIDDTSLQIQEGVDTMTFTVPTLTAARAVTFGDFAGQVTINDAVQTLSNKTISSPTITTSPTAAGATWTDLGSVTICDINGGTIDGTTIGATSAASATVTTITVNTGNGLTVGSSIPFSDSAGTLTLQNIDALDATTESTIEAAIDTLANLTSASGLVTVGTLTGGNADAIVSSASLVASGKVELATAAETTTGTDATRAVTPDGLAGSDYGKRVFEVVLLDNTTDVSTGDGKADIYLTIPAECNGWNLVGADASVGSPGLTGAMQIQIYNFTDSTDMLSSTAKISIDTNEATSYTAATPVIIGTPALATGDRLRFDVDQIHTTAAKGLTIILVAQLP